jgi:hypothetical protein
MKKKVYVKYKWSELKWFEANEPEPDLLDPQVDFVAYVRRGSLDRLLMWFSRHYYLKIIALLLIIVAIGFYLGDLHWVSYILGSFSLVSLLFAAYYYNLWRNNYFLVDALCAFAASYMDQKREEHRKKIQDNSQEKA